MTTEPEPKEDTTPAAAAEIRELVAAALGRMERGEQCRRCGRRQEPEQSLPLRSRQPGTRADGPVGDGTISNRPRRPVTSRPRAHFTFSGPATDSLCKAFNWPNSAN